MSFLRLLAQLAVVVTLAAAIAMAQAGGGSVSSNPPQPNSPAAQAPTATGTQSQSAGPATSSGGQAPAGHNSEAERERSGVDPLLDPRPLPNNPATLVGGTVSKLDRIRDRMALRPFGGGKMDIAFDMRTKFYRDGQPGTVHDLKPGSRVYVDTMLNGDQVFARTIRVQTQPTQGDARGQIVAYDSGRQVLTLREQVSPQPVKLRVTRQTTIQVNGKSGTLADLQAGSLATIHFEPGANGDVARNIHILATPGASFIFAGTVTFVDLRARRIAIDNRSDNENYEIVLGSVPSTMLRDVRVGSDATVKAVFDGQNYQARTIELANRAADSESKP